MSHVIQKQLFNLTASNIKQVREWEGKIHSIIHQVINPSIGRYFDEVAEPGEDIVIEKIELDLGSLVNKSPRELEESIRAQLISQIQKQPPIHTKSSTDSDAQATDNGVKFLTPRKKLFNCFVHFIRFGMLPWWAASENSSFEEDWIRSWSQQEAHQVATILREQPLSVNRIVYQFNERFITGLIQHYQQQEAEAILQNWQSIAKYYSLAFDNGALHKHYWKFWLEKSIHLSTEASQRNLQLAIAHWLQSPSQQIRKLLIKLTSTNENRKNIIDELFPSDFIRSIIREIMMNDRDLRLLVPDMRPFSRNVDASVALPSAAVQSSIENEIEMTEIIEKDVSHERPDVSNEDELFVSGAGVVLLHPFLTELFLATGLWSKSGWTSEFSQHQAVQLIAFMAFGESDLPEYALLLPKVLVNMPVSEPLDVRIGLPEKHKQLAEDLLTAVVSHWSAIGNTSIDGLREGFIQREGKLLQKNHNWQLTVESKAQDILLNRLPWGISYIHLPWLAPATLHIKWTN